MKNRYRECNCSCHTNTSSCDGLGNGVNLLTRIVSVKGIEMKDILFSLHFYTYMSSRKVVVRKDQLIFGGGEYYALINEKDFPEGWLMCDVEILEPANGWPHELKPVTVECSTGYFVGDCSEGFPAPEDCRFHKGEGYKHGYNITFKPSEEIPEIYDPTELFMVDEEDLTLVNIEKNRVAKFKDRDTSKGMGYIILRTGKSLAQQMKEKNTIYEIRYDFDLFGETLEIPEGCVLDFKGGSIRNGGIGGKNTIVKAPNDLPIFIKVVLHGTFHSYTNTSYLRWFNPVGDGVSDDTQCLMNLTCFDGNCELERKKEYSINSWIIVKSNSYWNLNGSLVRLNTHENISVFYVRDVDNVIIHGGSVIGPGVAAESNIEYGITVNSSSNILIKDIYISAFSRDGIYIGYEWNDVQPVREHLTENIQITNCTIDEVGRNGISLTSGDNVVVDNCIFKNITKTPPAAGIDIEPESSSKDAYLHINNIQVHDCIFENCGNSVEVYCTDFNYEKGTIFINRISCIKNSNIYIGASIIYGKGADIFIDGVTFDNPSYRAITIINPSTLFQISIKNIKFFGELTSPGWEFTTVGAISIFTQRLTTSTVERTDLGGVVISDVEFNLKTSSEKFKYLFSITHQSQYETGLYYESVKANHITIQNIHSDVLDCSRENAYYLDPNNIDYNTIIISPAANKFSMSGIKWKRVAVITNVNTNFDFKLTSGFGDSPDQTVKGSVIINTYGSQISITSKNTSSPLKKLRLTKDNSSSLYYLEVYNNVSHFVKYNMSIITDKVNRGKIICINQDTVEDCEVLTTFYLNSGTTLKSSLPTEAIRGDSAFLVDDLKPVWWNGTEWVDALGNKLNLTIRGTFSNKPSAPPIGFGYYCTDKFSAEGKSLGITIYYRGSGVWADALGRTVDDNYPIINSGTTEQRPTQYKPDGFVYFDTDLKKPIYWTGSKWVDATGTDV